MTRVVSPRSLKEAVAALSDSPDLIPVAGGTDLLVCPSEERMGMGAVVDLLRIPELHGIDTVEGGLRVGATTTFSEIRHSRRVRAMFPALAEAAAVVGGWQIQNRATLGGNMANASPAGDSLPVLLALDVMVVMVGPAGWREVAYSDFHLDYRKTALGPGELIAWVHIPTPAENTIQAFRKVGTREAQAISKVVVAMSVELRHGSLRNVRIGAGSVAPTPIRLRATEAECEGRTPVASVADRASDTALSEVRPIDDVRSTAAYRSRVLGRVVRRMILNLGSGA